MNKKTRIITVSGTSGAGKTFFVDNILRRHKNIHEIAGVTTRPKREGEKDGKSSHFYTLDYFRKLEENGDLLLIKEFFGNKYAWLKKDLVNEGDLRILNISYKSIIELKEMGLQFFSIFIRPDTYQNLERMLRLRQLSDEEFQKRIRDYDESEAFLREFKNQFDMIFTNDYSDEAIEKFIRIFEKQFNFVMSEDVDENIIKLLNEGNELDKKCDLADDLLDCYINNEKEEIL